MLAQSCSKNVLQYLTLKINFVSDLKIKTRMKNIFFSIAAVAALSACNNTPAVNESITKVTGLKTWVDSIKSIVDTTKNFDSTAWANYSAGFQDATSGINETELAEATKTTLEAIKTTWP